MALGLEISINFQSGSGRFSWRAFVLQGGSGNLVWSRPEWRFSVRFAHGSSHVSIKRSTDPQMSSGEFLLDHNVGPGRFTIFPAYVMLAF